MIDVILVQPEIPPNTGNVIRLCANTGCRLHLVKPLGFRLSERAARRAEGLVVGALERAPAHVAEPPSEALPDEPEGYAAGLYAALHRLEDAGCDAIVIAAAPEGRAWAAVRDRLRRASA